MLLIKGGNIIDGTGKSAYRADILVSQDKISAIGIFPKKEGVEVIDALGLNVCPGFIDVNTDSDHELTLFSNPSQVSFLLQGVTTIIGGHCGSSLAPLLYGSLESIRKWVDPNQINVNWHSVKDFLTTLSLRKLGINFGTLVGHSTIRRALIGEDMRDLTDNELSVFKNILTLSLEEGALGLSTGLGYAHSNLVPYSEIAVLTKIVSKFGAIYSTHLRNEEKDLEKSIQETISITQENNLNTLISHLRPIKGYEKNIDCARRMFDMLDKSTHLNFDVFPFEESVVPIYTLLPDWMRRGSLEYMLSKVGKVELPDFDLENMTIARAPFNQYLVGKKLSDYAIEKQLNSKEAMRHLMSATSLRAKIAIKNINLNFAEDMVFEARAMLASNSASRNNNLGSFVEDRSTKTFTRYFELAEKRPELTLENTVKKITSIPAKKIGIKNRGLLREGFFADIVLMRGSKIHHVLVNGTIAVQDSFLKNTFSGRIIKK